VFKLVKERTAWWPVIWSVPSEDGFKVEEAKVELQFRVKQVDDIQALVTRAYALGEAVDAEEEAKKSSDLMAEIFLPFVADWRGVADETGVAAAFGLEGLKLLFNMPGAFLATISAYRDCSDGVAAARLGN
jgi:hypothetical protein